MAVFEDCIRYVRGLAESSVGSLPRPPLVTIGGSTVQRPCELIVREMPEGVTFSDRSTSAMGRSGARGSYRVEFTVACQAWAKTRGLEESSFLVLGWVERFASAVAADKTLGGNAVHAEPFIGGCGTASEANRDVYLAACDFGVRVKAEVDPVKELQP